MTRKHFKASLVLLLCTIIQYATCQEGEPSSSMPSGFGVNQHQTTENLSSGVLNINLPIETQVSPVSLSYTTSGIRVNSRAGIIGLGWNLNAGGFIMRQVRGFADDHTEGYSGVNKRGSAVSASPTASNFKHLVRINGTGSGSPAPWDAEPDIYSYQFLGQSGSFTMDYNRNVVHLSPTTLKIEPTYSGTTNKYESFKITDENGNVYQFTVKESIRLLSNSVLVESYTYKWHLSSFTDYLTGDVTTFSYTNSSLYLEDSPFRSKRWFWGTSNLHSTVDQDVDMEYTSPKLLSQITHKNYTVLFSYGSRTDVTQLKKLSNVTYFTDGIATVSYTFNYKYLGTGTAQRLMLASVAKSSLNVLLYQFTYFGEGASEPLLPAYNSDKQDHWGFYNTNTASSLYVKLGANRSPNLANTQANSLRRIYDSSGGYEEYEFQLNEYRLSGSDYSAGGLRIYKLWRKDGEGSTYNPKTYNYDSPGTSNSSGEIYAVPDYDFKYTDSNAGQTLEEHREYSLSRLYDDQGRHLVYQYVTVNEQDGSRVQHKFKNFASGRTALGTDILSGSARFTKGWNRGTSNFESPAIVTLSLGGPFGYYNFKGNAAGLLEEKLLYDASSRLLAREYRTYTAKTPSTLVKGMNFLRQAYRKYGTSNRIDEFLVSVYELGEGYLLPTRIDKTTYDVTNFNKYKTMVTEIDYHATKPIPIREEEYYYYDQTNIRATETDYLFEETSPPASVATSNLVSLVKEKRTYIGTTNIAKTQYSYSNTLNGKLALSNDYKHLNGNLIGNINYTYDNTGKLIQTYDVFNGLYSSSVYDNLGRIIARGINVPTSRLAYTSFEMNDPGGWTTPTLTSHLACLNAYDSCMQSCELANPPSPTCFQTCDNNLTTCQNNANLTDGLFDTFAYKLSKGNITKSLSAGTYKLVYWKQSGSVTISGASSNSLIESRTLNGWTFESRKIVLSSAATLTISGTSVIDHLGLSPVEARVSMYTYHPLFGKSVEMDANNNLVFTDYDDLGRVVSVRDRNQDIITHTTYNIGGFVDLSQSSFSVPYTQTNADLFVVSNKTWSVSDNASWITLARDNNSATDRVTISAAQNTSTSSRTGTVTISGSGLTTQNISVVQAGSPSSYLTVSPMTMDISVSGQGTVTVTSNVSWTATVVLGGFDLSIMGGSGSGNGSFVVTVAPQSPDGSNTASLATGAVEVTGGGITRLINVTYSTFQ